jgi:hypothetical protein
MLDDRTLFADWILEAVGKRATAIATVQEMVEWFAQHYEDPAESTPYCSEEGGYMYLCGGPYDAREEIEARFAGKQGTFSADEWDAITAAAAAEVEEDGVDVWAKVIDDPEPEPDDYPEPDDEDKLAQFLQQSLQNLESLKKQFRCFGPADERCPHCGDLIETFLDKDGRHPMRCCWRCETATIERENQRDQSSN